MNDYARTVLHVRPAFLRSLLASANIPATSHSLSPIFFFFIPLPFTLSSRNLLLLPPPPIHSRSSLSLSLETNFSQSHIFDPVSHLSPLPLTPCRVARHIFFGRLQRVPVHLARTNYQLRKLLCAAIRRSRGFRGRNCILHAAARLVIFDHVEQRASFGERYPGFLPLPPLLLSPRSLVLLLFSASVCAFRVRGYLECAPCPEALRRPAFVVLFLFTRLEVGRFHCALCCLKLLLLFFFILLFELSPCFVIFYL